jgi:hypothetical protein
MAEKFRSQKKQTPIRDRVSGFFGTPNYNNVEPVLEDLKKIASLSISNKNKLY